MITQRAPEHMNRWARNERLYRHLLGLGLVVDPVFADEARTQIDHLRVSVDLPTTDRIAEPPTGGGIGAPMEWAKIDERITTAEGGGANVVDFPPIV